MSNFALFIGGFITGFVFAMFAWLFSNPEQSAAEAARDYAAYRACIERSSCVMTPQDWIDYYELKWRLEEKEVD